MFKPDLEKILSFKVFCRKQKRWKSLSARSGKYSGWGRTDQPKFNIFSSMILAEYGLVLSCFYY